MSSQLVENQLRQLDMFKRLPEPHLQFMARAIQVLTFQRGEVVIREGNPTQGMFIVMSGSASLIRQTADGSERSLKTLQVNGIHDEMALRDMGMEVASLHINEPTTLLFLSRDRMKIITQHFADVWNYINLVPPPPMVMPNTPPPSVPQSRPPVAPPTPQQPPTQAPTPTPEPPKQVTPPVVAHERQEPLQEIDGIVLGYGEQVLLKTRRHQWAWVRQIGIAVLLGGMACVGAFLSYSVSVALSLFVLGLGGIISFMASGYFYLEWRNDLFVVTNRRVISIERVIPTFSVSINEVPLTNIQQVNAELPKSDLFARVFNYGNVELKNASDAGDMVLDVIPNPDRVQQTIFEIQTTYRQQTQAQERGAIRAEIERSLGLRADAQTDAEIDEPMMSVLQQSSGLPFARTQFINDEGEIVIRRHLSVWLSRILAPCLVIFAGFVVTLVSFIPSGFVFQIAIVMAIAFWIIGALWLWWADWDWRNDQYIIGKNYITIIHKRPLWLQNEVEQILLNRLDNVVSETAGFFNTMLQRGDVKLSLVGEGLDTAKVLRSIYRPQYIQSEISRRQASIKTLEEEATVRRQRQEIAQYLGVFNEVNSSQR
ncbi:MAG: cyclic nucleotide-binding domain-containing protein [Phototrophicaceae bacterium]